MIPEPPDRAVVLHFGVAWQRRDDIRPDDAPTWNWHKAGGGNAPWCDLAGDAVEIWRPGQPTGDDIRTEERRRIAYDIRAELVCCDIYDRDRYTIRAGTTHGICFWGEAAARIAERDGTEDDEKEGNANE